MAENREYPAESVRTLSLLVEQNGIPWVAEAQQVGEDALLDMLDDNVEMDDATEANVTKLCGSVESGHEFIGSVGDEQNGIPWVAEAQQVGEDGRRMIRRPSWVWTWTGKAWVWTCTTWSWRALKWSRRPRAGVRKLSGNASR